MPDLIISIRQSGTHTIRTIVGGKHYRRHMRKLPDFGRARPTDLCHWHSYPPDFTTLVGWARIMGKTVIPLRDPRAIAVSWFIRRRVRGFLEEWQTLERLLPEINHFIFPMETQPYAELEDYLGREVMRVDSPQGSVGSYEEKVWYNLGKHDKLRERIGLPYKQAQRLIEESELARRFYA